MAVSRAGLRLVAGRRGRGRITVWLLAPAFLVVGGLGGTVLGSLSDTGLGRLMDAPVVQSVAVTVPADFGVCAGGVRVDCVVDGDTFWLAGTKIRIADIDTPEIGKPGCAGEAALGRRATTRLRELLSAGSFELQPVERDEDVYGRKLRVVVRDGQSIGDVLVAEGLAHQWRGRQESWC